MSKPTIASPWSSLKRSERLSDSSEMVEGMLGRRVREECAPLVLWTDQAEGRKKRRNTGSDTRERREEGWRDSGR